MWGLSNVVKSWCHVSDRSWVKSPADMRELVVDEVEEPGGEFKAPKPEWVPANHSVPPQMEILRRVRNTVRECGFVRYPKLLRCSENCSREGATIQQLDLKGYVGSSAHLGRG